MTRLAFVPLVALTVASFHSTIRPVPAAVRAELKAGGAWQKRCPVSLTDLRVLTVTHWGFDNRVHTGQLVVNKDSAAPLASVFHKLYDLPSLQEFERHLVAEADLEMDPRYGPWLNPPFFAWVFAPLSALPYRQAATVWLA